MAIKVKLTRPELKRYRDRLHRYQRYLPMLKLKQQQLQMTLRDVNRKREQAVAAVHEAVAMVEAYQPVFADRAGVPLQKWAQPQEIKTSRMNIAGVSLPVFQEALFAKPAYSLFATPAWVDQSLADLRTISVRRAELATLDEQHRLLNRELTKIIQRVNLFEKVKIPECQRAVRLIRIKLGDEMAAAVGRAKIAKNKISEGAQASAFGVEDEGKIEEESPTA